MTLPPGPRAPSPVQLLRYVLRTYEFFDGARRRYGTPFTARFAGFGTFVFLADPAAIRDVFTGDPAALHSGEGNAFLAETLGPSSLLVLDEEPHWRQRRPQLPPFHGDRMRAHTGAMRAATLRRIEGWGAGAVVRLEEECREITLQVILETIFGTRDEAFAARFRALMRLFDHPLGLLATLVPRVLRPLTPWRKILRLQAEIDAALVQLIARRRAGPAGDDVLGALLGMAHDDGVPLGDREIRDHLFTLLIAGHDTTAVALAWAFELILAHPDVLARVREEAAGGGEELPYLDAAIREALRLRPVVPFVVRLVKRDFDAGGRTWPEGIHLAPCMLLVQREPDLYPEPEAFRPERFLDMAPDPYAWFPFGGGRRRCLGMAYALHEMRVVLATVLSRVKLELPPGRKGGVRRKGILLAPRDGTTALVR